MRKLKVTVALCEGLFLILSLLIGLLLLCLYALYNMYGV